MRKRYVPPALYSDKTIQISGVSSWDCATTARPAFLLTLSRIPRGSRSCISFFGGIDFYFVLFALLIERQTRRKSPARQLGNFPRANQK